MKIKLLVFTLATILCLAGQQACASTFSYSLPQSISLKFAENAIQKADGIEITALLQSSSGNLSDLEIFFESSRDLKVINQARKLKNLKAGQIRKIRIMASKTEQKSNELGSWIKMSVKYRPDYQEIKKIVESNHIYPDKFERQKLQDAVKRNAEADARYLDAARWFADLKGNLR